MANLRQGSSDSGEETGRGRDRDGGRPSSDPLDEEGIPRAAAVSDWLDLFDPSAPLDPRTSRWLQAVLRFSRSDGSPVFGPRGRSKQRLRALDAWARRIGDPSLSAVIVRWISDRENTGLPASPPPVASYSCPNRPLAILRPDWSTGGDLVAIDHRQSGDSSLLEVASRGRTWIGPSWTSGEVAGKVSRASRSAWMTSPFADFAEWTFKAGTSRVTRSVVLLRGRSMALLGQQDNGGGEVSQVRFDLGEGVEASPIEGSRALLLSTGRGQPTARLLPLGLPSHDRSTDLGSIAIEGRQVVIRQSGPGRRRWLPTLLCWGKAPTTWRSLTVAFRSKICRGDVASAVRVTWGPRDEDLLIYRSLAAPELRSFLGHQSSSRFLIGGFQRSGEVRPILKVES